MPRTPRPYKKLPGKYSRFYTVRTMWQAADHLLSVEASLTSEHYRRFYFKDIQALVVRQTNVGKIWNALLGGAALVPGLLAAFAVADGNDAGAGLGAVFAAFFLLLLVINVLRGPTCETHVQTAAQFEKIPSLWRWRTAVRALARLRPLIEAVQGPLAVPARFAAGEPGMARPDTQARSKSFAAQALKPLPSLLWHRTLFGLILLAGGAFLLLPVLGDPAPAVAAEVLLTGALGVVIVAMVRQQGSRLTPSLKTATWLALGLVLLEGIRGSVFFMLAAVRNPLVAHKHWELVQAMVRMYAMDHPVVTGVNLLMAAAGIGIGAMGLAVSRNSRGSVNAP